MKGERNRKRDNNIIKSIGGNWNPGIKIEEGYFERERRENSIEQGLPVDDLPELTYSDKERMIRKNNRDLSEVEGERVNRVMPEYPGKEDDMSGERPEMKFTEFKDPIMVKGIMKRITSKKNGKRYVILTTDKSQFMFAGWALTDNKALWEKDKEKAIVA